MTETASRRAGLWHNPLWLGNTLIVALGVLAPTAVFVAIRIGLIRSCTGINILDLPWHPVASTTVMIFAALVAAASLAMVVVGYATPGMRAAAAAVTVFGALSIVPVLLALFMSVYGDPGPVCDPS